MMCIVWAVLALGLLGLSIITWAAFRILVLSSAYDYPEIPDELMPGPLSCPRCEHRCETCFKGTRERPVEVYHCNECGWIGPLVSGREKSESGR